MRDRILLCPKGDPRIVRTFSYFEHKGRKVHIWKYAALGRARSRDTLYRVTLDGEELPVNWPNPHELEVAIRRLLDEQEAEKV